MGGENPILGRIKRPEIGDLFRAGDKAVSQE